MRVGAGGIEKNYPIYSFLSSQRIHKQRKPAAARVTAKRAAREGAAKGTTRGADRGVAGVSAARGAVRGGEVIGGGAAKGGAVIGAARKQLEEQPENEQH